MWLLTYLRLKLTVTFYRLALRLKSRRWMPLSTPDSVLRVPSSDPSYTKDIKVHVYNPPASSQPIPVLINLHGSGFVFPLHGSDDAYCRHIAQRTGHTVLDMQYRLAPEYTFPAPLHDLTDVVRHVLARPDAYDTTRISLSGFSAGANAVLAIAADRHAFPAGTFRAVLAFYPPTNLAIDPAEKQAPDTSGRPIPPSMARLFDSCYIPPGTNKRDPRLSPSFAEPEAFPDSVMVLTGAQDGLALEAEALAGKVEGVPGKKVVRKRFEGVGHAWDKVRAKEGSVYEKARTESYALAVEILME
ncbi:uncharacterized protein K452DRAFT_313749 [Aplosporella prunicola CBS 121167]|uniref:Alpha/beta hydrolase fold-3 domain-containing protein n=1 Tax=Aplosporella prunicola CBS 121167 TaxID=1176127 RepID=A0A6A6AXP7_9PEZI|nr:uncharacterized protein K452DRAFT_313749 [Aplosporella prunicola CBS 121167]KAF2135755.1 hypothetical protein K452DRAFT_313749 [Aplosporella prunicola CBS 121167]